MNGKLFSRILLGIATGVSTYAVALLLEDPAMASGSCKINSEGCQVVNGDSYSYGTCNSVAYQNNCLCLVPGFGSPGAVPYPSNACQNP
jgi:hypothetical protein